MRLQFGLDAYEHRSKSIAAQRIVNGYLEKTTDNADNPVVFVGSYGIDDFAVLGVGSLRGGRVINDVAYVVAGTGLYTVDAVGTETLLGSIPGADRVSLAGDGTNVAVCSDGVLYVWDGSTVEVATTPVAFETVDSISVYFIGVSGGQVYVSDPLDPTTWNGLDFISAEASPDDIVGTIVEKGELFCGGKDTIQAFTVTDSDVPLDRSPNGIAEIGLLSKYGFAKIDNSIFFPATDCTVRRLDDLTSAEKAALHGMCWTEAGHNFYGLSSARWTFVYDASTQLWHQRQSHGLEYWRPFFALSAYKKVLVGDQDSSKLGVLDAHTFTEWGEPVTMLGTCNVAEADGKPVFGPMLELMFDRGVGLLAGQGSDPQVMMRQSFDGGKTWTSERWRSLGATGDYLARAMWARCGRARQRIVEFSISDPVRRALSYANFIDPEVGD
jgi:hypothetical protein